MVNNNNNEPEEKTVNINVAVDIDTYYKLRENAVKKHVDFHNYIRMIFQEVD